MNADEALDVIEHVLLSRQLTPIERLILRQSWLGKKYGEMVQDTVYGSAHIKEIGSQLWQSLSEAIGERVTKKNLHLVLPQYQQKQRAGQLSHVSPALTEGVEAQEFSRFVEYPGEPVPLDSPFYIDRPPIEALTCTEISQSGCVIRIKAPRKMGKSSLLNRIVHRATALGYQTVSIDFQEADEEIFASLDKFLRWFCANVSRQLHLPSQLDEYWDEEIGSKVSCKIYFEEYLLEQIHTPLLVALNEVHRVFEHVKIAQEFLPMLRFWHEQARVVETWEKLRLVVVHATEIYIPLQINQSPFNVGLSVKLPPFTSEQVQELAKRYGLSEMDGSQTEQLMAMVGGHPYLVNVALYHLMREEMSLAQLLQAAPTQAGIYSHHLRGYLAMLQDEPHLAATMQQVVSARQSIQVEAIAAYKLESMGLIELEGDRAQPSCQLYRLYFRAQLAPLAQAQALHTRLEQLEREKQELQRLTNIDELTQLANRRYFNQHLEREWQQQIGKARSLALMLCDIDYFRFYNDAHGQIAGDVCLQQMAEAIRDCARDRASVIARYGGEEFALLLSSAETEAVVALAQAIRERVKALNISHGQVNVGGFPAEVITVSIGVVSATPNAQVSSMLLMAAADEALAQAKRQGRDRVVVHELSLDDEL
jgi:diguanylate cyclase (GGDEF)-like protein